MISVTHLLNDIGYLEGMIPAKNITNKEEKLVTWFSRLLRWGLGMLFIIMGIVYFNKGGWPAILFGILIFITGFFKPKRCLDNCTIDQN